MESQKVKNLLDHKDEVYSRYQTIKNGMLLMIEIMAVILKRVVMINQ